MKTMKRIVSTLLAALLLATMLVIPASAAGEYSITITGTTHTYKAYQIFSGTYNPSDSVLTNVEWGEGVNNTTILGALQADPTISALFAGASSAAQVASALEGKSGTVVDAFAKVVAANLSGTASGTGAESGSSDYKISNLDEGYYIVIDQGVVGEGDAYSKHIVHVVGNVTVSPKAAVPTLSKTVSRDKISYTKGVSTSFGDTVSFQLDAKLHDRILDFSRYYLEFTDVLPAGLTYTDNSIKVYIRTGGTEKLVENTAGNNHYTLNINGQNLAIEFDDVKSTIKTVTGADAVADDHVIIKYDTTLDQDAVIGSTGNMNTAKLKYTSDPNHPDSYKTATATTKQENAYVYTYQLKLHKVDGADNTKDLQGASFKLSRAVSNGFEFAQIDPNTRNITGWTDEENASVLTTDVSGLVTVNGLASTTTYYLKETAAPTSYNPIEETIRVTINATATLDGKLDTLSATTAYGGATVEEIDKTSGSITIKIPNVKGTVLPSTGGMGTTLFYTVGTGLMLSAAGVLLAKKRFARG